VRTPTPPILRAIAYYVVFFGGVLVASLNAGFQLVGGTVEDYPTWYKFAALGVWPVISSAFGLLAASNVDLNKNGKVEDDEDRYEGYKPERALSEIEVREMNAEEWAREEAKPDEHRNVEPMTEPIMSPFFRDDTDPNQPKLFRPERRGQ
jgi:hypothetical protein